MDTSVPHTPNTVNTSMTTPSAPPAPIAVRRHPPLENPREEVRRNLLEAFEALMTTNDN